MPIPYIAWIIFKGLPSSFDSLASRKYEDISSNLNNINISKLISELISEEACMNSNNLEANKVYNKSNTIPYCKHCNKRGHLESKCYIKYPELSNNSNTNSNSNSKNKTKNKNKNKSNTKDNNTKGSDKTLMLASTKNSTITSSNNTISYSISSFYSNSNNTIILDSGASEHFTPNKEWLLDYKPIANRYITIANGTKCPLLGVGKIPILTSNNTEILVTEVNYVPDIKTTLLSTKVLANKGWRVTIEDDIAKVVNKSNSLTILAKWKGNAYYFLDLEVDYSKLEKLVYKTDTSTSKLNIDLIHKRLNHINKDYLIKTINDTIGYSLNKTSKTELEHCDSCIVGKITKNISYKTLDSNKDILTYFDLDIAGPFRIKGLLGERYFITFTCRTTRAVYIYCLKHKSEAIDKLIELDNLLQKQLNISIKGTHSDNALEFKSNKWVLYCKNKGIYNDYNSPYSSEQMGISERLNRYILERLITICNEKNIPLFLWPYIVRSIVYIKNRTYNSTTKTIPYISIFNTKPNITSIKILGSLSYSLISKEVRTKGELGKLANKANIGILVGWESSNNYLVYVPNLQKVISTRDVIIKENLVYKDKYIIENNIEQDYTKLLEDDSSDFNFIKEITNNSNSREPRSTTTIDYTKENNSNTNIRADSPGRIDVLEFKNTTDDSSSSSSEEDNDDKDDNDDDDDIDELSPEYDLKHNTSTSKSPYKPPTTRSHTSTKLASYNKDINSIYNLASTAYLTSKIEGDSTSNNNEPEKVIINKTKDTIILEPKTYNEAISDNNPYKDYWIRAMQKEIDSANKNNTWDIITSNTSNSNSNIIPIKTRWVYKLKESSNNIIEFKARFVAKGFEQVYGKDYIDSYAAVIKQIAWKILFAIAILNNYYIYKIDMVSAFTQGNIDTKLYLKLPLGLEYIKLDPKLNNNLAKCLLLNKALYGLKQSARIWYFTLIDKL